MIIQPGGPAVNIQYSCDMLRLFLFLHYPFVITNGCLNQTAICGLPRIYVTIEHKVLLKMCLAQYKHIGLFIWLPDSKELTTATMTISQTFKR